MYRAFSIKYGEIGVKGKNRYVFEDMLVKQIRFALNPVDGEFEVRKEQGRIYAEVISDEYDYDETVAALKNVFGIVAFCPVVLVDDEGFDKLAEDVDEFHGDQCSAWRKDP